MNKKILITASVLGIIAIILGAFGAHALKELISVDMQQTFETGVHYQMYHALFLLFVGTTTLVTEKTKKTIYYLIIVGVLFFSGSIYGLATNNLTSFDFKSIGFITPIGGLCFIISWGLLFIDLIKTKGNN
ncbi:DUF423 domain-containing protein [Flavobacteriaceae bacterium XHP0103]|uniref:DUF423 domain-containing protein n=1 Tax=Marixanthotalea marina TaxID=2844359 RepID=UPI002989CCEB|nr:DUF423 domain-containing protein [Marixanthotalea marina]MBU3822105.1 DUF423 domain-containing protein [Marixanthotalea marina]